jgi:ribosome biogenesis protein BMS1
MRITGKVRAELGLSAPLRPDSTYRHIERSARRFNPLKIPKSLQAALPYASKLVQMTKQKRQTYMQKRQVIPGEEKLARDLMQQVIVLRNEKVQKQKERKAIEKVKYMEKVQNSEELRRTREKREKKEYWEREGRKRKAEGSGNERGKRKKN